jgi:uncharacterized membrane protein
MNKNDPKSLKAAARQAAAAASYDPQKLILIHSAVATAAGLVLALIGYLLQLQIDNTGGLSGVGNRAMLETARSVLDVLFQLALPFWQIGFVYAAIRIIRHRNAEPYNLGEGFRRFRAVLKTQMLVVLFTCGMVFACYYAAYFLYAMTPWSRNLMDAMMSGNEETLMAAMEEALLPIGILMLPPLLVVGTWFGYRMRLVDYVIMDDGDLSGLAAIRQGWKLTKGNIRHMLKLDLSYWWYYGLTILTAAVAYGDMILPALGVTLPLEEAAGFYLFMAASYVLQLLLLWWQGSRVQLSYAAFYQAALPREEEE